MRSYMHASSLQHACIMRSCMHRALPPACMHRALHPCTHALLCVQCKHSTPLRACEFEADCKALAVQCAKHAVGLTPFCFKCSAEAGNAWPHDQHIQPSGTAHASVQVLHFGVQSRDGSLASEFASEFSNDPTEILFDHPCRSH